MVSDPIRNFEEAVARFRALLKANDYSENVVWLTPKDVLLTGRRFVYVHVPLPVANLDRIGQMYAEGVTQGRGLAMGAIGGIHDSTYCYLLFPKSVEEVPHGIWPPMDP